MRFEEERAKLWEKYKIGVNEPIFQAETPKELIHKRNCKQGRLVSPKEVCERYNISRHLFYAFLCRSEIVDFIAAENRYGTPILLYDNQYLTLEIKMHFNRKKINVK